MEGRQRSHRKDLGVTVPAQHQDEELGEWPGKRSLTQSLEQSSGQSLPGELAGKLSSSLGADVSGVRVHVDDHAATAAQGLHAKAFTVGQAVYFNRGHYDPSSAGGQRLIAHEVAHTVQQGGASGRPQLESLGVSSPGDAHETEAESFAQSFMAKPGARHAVTPVSRGVISRMVIQRDLLDGTPPATMQADPAPVNAKQPSASELQQQAAEAIRKARAEGGTPAVVNMVRKLRSGGTATTSGPTETAIATECNEAEKKALSGGTDASATANATAADPKNGNGGKDGPQEKTARPNTDAKTGGDPAAAGDAKAEADPGAGGGGGATKTDGDAKKGPAQTTPGKDTGHPGTEAEATTPPAVGTEPATENAPVHEHPPEVSAAGGKELIEQELAFHEQWKVYASGSKADRIGHLAKTMFVGNDGSALHGDLAQGAIGAGTQFGMGLGVKLLATKTIASRVPGVGNIIGGALSAYSLFSNGGAGIKKMGSEISEGIGGAFSAKNWSESPWLTAANLVSGIKGVFELAGHILNILSGLAYAFAAIAALGGLLSVFFPPLAILVPYIPMAVNFGRACGGIATVCMGIANLLSPIPPVLRAIHLIFSDNDPIKLVGAEKKYHEDVQGALATYGSAKMSNALSAKGSKTLGIAADPNAPKSVYGKGGSIQSEMKEGFGAYKDAMGGNVAPTPANFAKGTENTKQALGIPDNVTGGKTGNAKDIGASYFNPEGRATANAAATDAAEKKVDKAEKQLDVDKKNQAYVEGRADKAQQRLDANPTEKNFKAASNAAATAEKHEAKVEASEASVKSAEQTAKLAEHRQEIVQGRQGAEGIGGSAGDAGDSARKQAIENHDAPIEKGKEKSADEAFESLREGQAPVEATRNAAGHIQLPDPPGNLQEVESIDEEIEALRKQQEAAHETGTEAKQVQKETSTQASGLDTASAGVTAKVQGEQTRSAAEQAKVKQQNTDMQAKTAETGASTKGGISQGGGSLNTIAGAARTIDGFLGRVPSNKFFDPSATKNNVHQFVVGLDTITGANGQQSSSQAQATSAVGQRTSQVNEAQTANAAANTEGQKLAQDMKADASTAKTASSQAAGVANEAKTAEAGAKAKIAQLTSQRQQKWQALLAWAAQHRALREQAKTPE